MPNLSKPADAFAAAVERALDHAHDPVWLGHHSPLATPYVLGRVLEGEGNTPAPTAEERGRALRAALHAASRQLDSDQQELLDVTFFKRDPHLNNVGVALQLSKTPTSFYRHRTTAINDLARELNRQLLPPLRPEQPADSGSLLKGRATALSSVLRALRAGQSVAVTGESGMGKTALGAAIANQWGLRHTFWFTVRPGLNDHMDSLVFGLGYFLRTLNASNLWRQLVADDGAVKADRCLALLRHDLAELRARNETPLICVDELDLLNKESLVHARLLQLLDQLKPFAPLLLVGQRLVLEADTHIALEGLDIAAIEQFLHAAHLPLPSPALLEKLTLTTHGNPALLMLVRAFCHTSPTQNTRAEEVLAEAIQQLASAPSLPLMCGRVWQRLDADEQGLLMELAVFRGAAPHDVWLEQTQLLDRLTELGVVRMDGVGGCDLAEYWRTFSQEHISANMRPALHLAAARVRESRGEYTEACYHFIQGGQVQVAVWLWLNHFRAERSRGQGAAALALFGHEAIHPINSAELTDPDDRRALAVLRGELLILTGDAAGVTEQLHLAVWPEDHALTPRMHKLAGDALEMQGQLEQAVIHYRASLAALANAPQHQAVDLHSRIGYIQMVRQRDLSGARREALLAQAKAQDFQGNVEEEAGNFEQANTHYQTALDIVNTLPNSTVAQCRSHGNLGRLMWKQGNLESAISHLNIALSMAEQVGSVISPLYDYINLAAAYIQSNRYEEALAVCMKGLPMSIMFNHAYLIAGLSSNAGEACVYLNRLDEAESYATQALRQEEDAWQPYAATVIGLLQHRRGQYDRAESSLRAAVQFSQVSQDVFAEAAAWQALTDALMAQQKFASADEAITQGIACFATLHLDAPIQALQALRRSLRDQNAAP